MFHSCAQIILNSTKNCLCSLFKNGTDVGSPKNEHLFLTFTTRASCMLKFIVICIECGHWRIRSYFLTRKRFVICSILLVIRKCIRISPKNRFLVCSIPRTHRSKQQSDETAQTLFPFTIRILVVVGCNVGLGGHVNCVVAPTTI